MFCVATDNHKEPYLQTPDNEYCTRIRWVFQSNMSSVVIKYISGPIHDWHIVSSRDWSSHLLLQILLPPIYAFLSGNLTARGFASPWSTIPLSSPASFHQLLRFKVFQNREVDRFSICLILHILASLHGIFPHSFNGTLPIFVTDHFFLQK